MSEPPREAVLQAVALGYQSDMPAPRILSQGRGEIAQAIVDRVSQGPLPGTLSLEDMAAYRPVVSEALCVAWKGVYRVCTARPPAGGSAQAPARAATARCQ
jgi:hypothetical protein